MIVCGGAGFIGGTFVRKYGGVVLDKGTYAASGEIDYKTDICDEEEVNEFFNLLKPRIVINFAAETHVDNSIKNSTDFINTNVLGVRVLLDACRKCNVKKFIHISTDEVYGEIRNGSFNEKDRLNPGNPYSASKAAGDLLIQSYIRTHDFPAIIIRPCNNYGFNQNREKFIPSAIQNNPIKVYGKGKQKREWIWVEDCVDAIWTVLLKGKIGGIYNVGSGEEYTNLRVAKMISEDIEFVSDRPGHDFRYSMNSSKIRRLGWKPKVRFKDGLDKLLNFHLTNGTLYNTN